MTTRKTLKKMEIFCSVIPISNQLKATLVRVLVIMHVKLYVRVHTKYQSS
jgi:hypothetical protein